MSLTALLIPLLVLRRGATAGMDDKMGSSHRHGEIKVLGFWVFFKYQYSKALKLLLFHMISEQSD